MKVSHTQFGIGTVVSQDAENVTVDFNGTVKTLVIKFARLSNEDGTPFGSQFVAPVKKAAKLNKANFMSKEEFSKSIYSTMSKNDFEEERMNATRNSKSF